MKKDHKSYYLKNKDYTNFLDKQDTKEFKKYKDYIKQYLGKKSKFLDVGCGSGIVLSAIKNKDIEAYGIEVSHTSVALCKKKKLRASVYDGDTIPFQNNFFDVVGSYNVLEHVEKPIRFLNEQLRVVKKGGYIVVACPNFLSVTNSYHWHTRGMSQKFANFIETLRIIFKKNPGFSKMQPVIREVFEVDDDAVNVTNPVSIIKWGKSKKLQLVYWSGRTVYASGLSHYLDRFFLKTFLGSSFLVFKK